MSDYNLTLQPTAESAAPAKVAINIVVIEATKLPETHINTAVLETPNGMAVEIEIPPAENTNKDLTTEIRITENQGGEPEEAERPL